MSLLAVLLFFISTVVNGSECDLSLRHSSPIGVGVYAGRAIESGETVEVAIGVPIPLSAIYWTELVNYSEGFNDTHALFTLGSSALYNHVPNSDHEIVRKFMSHAEGRYAFRAPFQRSVDVDFVSKRDIDMGEQMLAYYGNDWFQDRGWTELHESVLGASDSNTISDLPGCAHGNTALQDNVLVAKRPLRAGEVIEVARALLIPDWAVVEDSPLVDLLWWPPSSDSSETTDECQVGKGGEGHCGALERSKQRRRELRPSLGSPYRMAPWNRTTAAYAVLLTGHGALYGHASESPSQLRTDDVDSASFNQREPNVRYDWYDVGSGAADDVGSASGVPCSLLMMVSFIATRDIQTGEAMVVDLSLDTDSHRRYVRKDFASLCL
jgi:hypothetical protein